MDIKDIQVVKKQDFDPDSIDFDTLDLEDQEDIILTLVVDEEVDINIIYNRT